jgi:hypothetical protein
MPLVFDTGALTVSWVAQSTGINTGLAAVFGSQASSGAPVGVAITTIVDLRGAFCKYKKRLVENRPALNTP